MTSLVSRIDGEFISQSKEKQLIVFAKKLPENFGKIFAKNHEWWRVAKLKAAKSAEICSGIDSG